MRARVAIPVPGAAEAAAFLHDAHVVDAGFLEPGACHQPGESAADEGEGHVIALGLALGPRYVGVLQQVLELASELQVLLISFRSQPLGPLAGVPFAERVNTGRRHSCYLPCRPRQRIGAAPAHSSSTRHYGKSVIPAGQAVKSVKAGPRPAGS